MRRPFLLPLQTTKSASCRLQPRRAFLSSPFHGLPPQRLRAQRTLPYPSSTLFKIVASVESYPTFLPFILSSKITARDHNRWPSEASLDIGYAGFRENFTSRVSCDPKNLIVEAVSGDDLSPISGKIGTTGMDEGLFEFLRTKWSLHPIGSQDTEVDLLIEVKFKSALYSAMMQAAAPGVAGLVIKAFEKRVEEVVMNDKGIT